MHCLLNSNFLISSSSLNFLIQKVRCSHYLLCSSLIFIFIRTVGATFWGLFFFKCQIFKRFSFWSHSGRFELHPAATLRALPLRLIFVLISAVLYHKLYRLVLIKFVHDSIQHLALYSLFSCNGAGYGTWTHTSKIPDPKSGASANSANPAYLFYIHIILSY